MLSLDLQIARTGFIVFDDYLSKLKMMSTPLFLFGMKLYRQLGSIEFFDADFCTTLLIKSVSFDDRPLGEVCEIINEALVKSNYEHSLI